MPIGSVNNNILQQNPYAKKVAFSQRTTANDEANPAPKTKLDSESEINKITSDIEKEESKLSELQKEMVQHISNGQKEQADLKSVEIQQKQMSITLMNAKIKELSSSKTGQSSSLKMPRDEYIPSGDKPNEVPGIYRMEKDENDQSKIIFDRPDSPEKSDQTVASVKEGSNIVSPEVAPKQSESEDKAHDPEKSDDKKEAMQCTADTGKVDREIKKLKEEKNQIEQELKNVSADENKRKDLEQQLSQIESELSAKDNDRYRKQNATYTNG